MDSSHLALCTLQTRVELYQQTEALMLRRRGLSAAGGASQSATQSPEDVRALVAQLQGGAEFVADQAGVEKVIAEVKASDEFKEATPEEQALIVRRIRKRLSVGSDWMNYTGTASNVRKRKRLVLTVIEPEYDD